MIKDRILLRYIKNLFEHEKQEVSYSKSWRVSNFWCNNYFESESNSDRNKTISLEEFRNRIRPFSKDVNNLKKSDNWKIQLKIANNFISYIDNDEHCLRHSKSDNTGIMTSDEADEVINNFNSPKNRYQNNLESMKGSKFVCNA